MRKTLLGMMLAVTTTMPTLATAQQDGQGQWRGQREASQQGGQQGGRGQWSQQRGDGQQQGRQQQPAAQPQGQVAPPQVLPPQQVAAPQRQVQQRPQGGWNRSPRDGGRQGGPDGHWLQAQGGRQDRPVFNEARPQQAAGRRAQGDARFDPRGGRGDARHGGGYAADRGGQEQRGYGDRRDGARFADGGEWNRGWRGNDRYDYGGYRSANRGAFHLPRYYAPRGWNGGYRRFSVGIRLSSVLFGENYWLDDAYDYRLPPAYGPYRWVRYYNDALLVDVRSGYVVDTVYDIFW